MTVACTRQVAPVCATSDFRFQISDFRFQIFRSRHAQTDYFREISDFRFEIAAGHKGKHIEGKQNSLQALLLISAQRRRSQITQITSHARSARDKQKSGAQRLASGEFQIPERRSHFCLNHAISEFYAPSQIPILPFQNSAEQEGCRADPRPGEICKTR